MILRALCCAFCALGATAALAGALVNNGGKVVVCADKISLFDYFEAQALRGWTPSLGAPDLPVQEKIDLVLARLAPFDPLRAERYREWSRAFAGESELLASTLPDVPDQEPVMDPPAGCAYEQIVIQRQPVFDGDKRYFINKSLFESALLSNDDKAGLILHEIFYREAIGFGADNSLGARHLNALFSANRLDELRSEQDYFALLPKAGYQTASYHGVWVELRAPYGFSTGDANALIYAVAVAGTTAATAIGPVELHCEVRFAQDGRLEAFSLWQGRIRLELGGQTVDVAPHTGGFGTCDGDFDVQNALSYPDSITVNASNWLQRAVPGGTMEVAGVVSFRAGEISRATHVNEEDHPFPVIEVAGSSCPVRDSGISFYLGGAVASLAVKQCFVTVGGSELLLRGQLHLTPDGVLDQAMLAAASTLNLVTHPGGGAGTVITPVLAAKDGEDFDLAFYADGGLKRMILGSRQRLIMADGSQRDFAGDTELNFDGQGRVTTYFPRSR